MDTRSESDTSAKKRGVKGGVRTSRREHVWTSDKTGTERRDQRVSEEKDQS